MTVKKEYLDWQKEPKIICSVKFIGTESETHFQLFTVWRINKNKNLSLVCFYLNNDHEFHLEQSSHQNKISLFNCK